MSTRTLVHVDDSTEMRELLRRTLARTKVDLTYRGTDSGLEALRWLEGDLRGKPLVLVLDVNMPEMSGIEVLEALVARGLIRDVPVVMLTTSAEAADRDMCLSLGAKAYCVKPVDLEPLRALILHMEELLTRAE